MVYHRRPSSLPLQKYNYELPVEIAFTVVTMIPSFCPEHIVVIVLFFHFRNELSEGLSSHPLHEILFTLISNILIRYVCKHFTVRNRRSIRKSKQALQLESFFHLMMKQRLRFLQWSYLWPTVKGQEKSSPIVSVIYWGSPVLLWETCGHHCHSNWLLPSSAFPLWQLLLVLQNSFPRPVLLVIVFNILQLHKCLI